MTQVRSIHPLIARLERSSPKIAALGMSSILVDEELDAERFNFANDPAEITMVCRSAETLEVSEADLRKMVTDLLSQKNHYGQLCEFAVYDWLARHDAGYTVQVAQTGADVLNPNGTDLDGMFEGRDAYFDIKGFGFESYVREKFRKKLSEMVSKRILIEGSRDNAVKDIEGAFRKLKDLATDLQRGDIAKLPELDWTIRATTSSLSFEESFSDPYATAEQNWYYPFKTARQFHRHNAFVLIFAFSPRFNGLQSVNFSDTTLIALRSLARRAFLQTKGDATPVSKFDAGADSNVTLDEASQLLSGLLFLNFTDGNSWFFLNPRAKHPLKKDYVPQLFDFAPPHEMMIDDFAHDNY
ncbi:hypothetical protein ACVMAJ_003551 [Bradyrhizobium sp. USDA 4448]